MPHSALARPCAIDPMFDYQRYGLVGGELGSGHHRPQQLSHICHRQRWQHIYRKLLRQPRVPGIPLCPLPFGLPHKPARQGRQRQMMLPCPILLGLQLVPSRLGLGVLVRSLYEVALTHQPAQLDLGLKAPLCRNPQPLTFCGHLRGKPGLGQEQLPVHPGPHGRRAADISIMPGKSPPGSSPLCPAAHCIAVRLRHSWPRPSRRHSHPK